VSDTEGQAERVTKEDPPPFLGTWRRVYLFVICYLAFLIAVFFLFARAFNS
jgi:hypothetical protein